MNATQQETLYASERALLDGRTFPNVEAVERWINDDLRESWWWERWCANVIYVEVGIGRPGAGVAGVGWFDADANAGRLEFARDAALTERRVVHELAHVIAKARRNSTSHDPWFARIYLELTYLVRGQAQYEVLKKSFDAHGIDYDAGGMP